MSSPQLYNHQRQLLHGDHDHDLKYHCISYYLGTSDFFFLSVFCRPHLNYIFHTLSSSPGIFQGYIYVTLFFFGFIFYSLQQLRIFLSPIPSYNFLYLLYRSPVSFLPLFFFPILFYQHFLLSLTDPFSLSPLLQFTSFFPLPNNFIFTFLLFPNVFSNIASSSSFHPFKPSLPNLYFLFVSVMFTFFHVY